MQVELTSSRAGQGIDWWDGDIVELPTDEAMRLIAADQAKPVGRNTEAAVVGPAETAALSHQPNFRKRGRKYVSNE